MDADKLVRAYLDAWNSLSPEAVISLLHPGAAYYDAFWMESCVGRDLERYFRDNMAEEPFTYRLLGEIIETGNAVAFRYAAFARDSEEVHGEPLYEGSEVLHVLGDKILTMSDFYCNPDPAALKEIAEETLARHGIPVYADAGYSSIRNLRMKNEIARKLEEDQIYLDPDISVAGLAKQLGCSIDHLSRIVNRQFGAGVSRVLDTHRIGYATELLRASPDAAYIEDRTASLAGFRSLHEFQERFRQFTGLSPAEFCKAEIAKRGRDRNSH